METVIGGREDRFCLRSELNKSEYGKTFLSPVKLMSSYGPKSPLGARTLTASPSMSSLTLTSQTEEEPIETDAVLGILQQHSISENDLLEKDLDQIKQLSDISEEDMLRLLAFRELLLDHKCEKELTRILGDFPAQDKFFKKW